TVVPAPPARGVRSSGLSPGTRAPTLSLPATPDGRVMDVTGLRAPVLLVFYPADFTPVCNSELSLFNELLPDMAQLGARVFGISVDSVWSHMAFAQELKSQIPLLSDFHPKANVSQRYRVYRDEDGFSERALFVIGPDGVIFW